MWLNGNVLTLFKSCKGVHLATSRNPTSQLFCTNKIWFTQMLNLFTFTSLHIVYFNERDIYLLSFLFKIYPINFSDIQVLDIRQLIVRFIFNIFYRLLTQWISLKKIVNPSIWNENVWRIKWNKAVCHFPSNFKSTAMIKLKYCWKWH
jgi:hypothetical protein